MKETPSERLQRLRRRHGFEHAADAARAYGWKETTYRAHENGHRDISRNAARKYAAVFGVTVDELLEGHTGDPDYERTVKRALAIRTLPRLDWEMAQSETLDQQLGSARDYSSIPADILVSNRGFTLVNEDDSMVDVEARYGVSFRPHNLLIIDPDRDPGPGDFVIAQVKHSSRWVFRQYRVVGYEDGNPIVHLVPFNPTYPVYKLSKDDRIIGALAARLDTF
jgi:SOS-response transcriptional repressor LexA